MCIRDSLRVDGNVNCFALGDVNHFAVALGFDLDFDSNGGATLRHHVSPAGENVTNFDGADVYKRQV